MNTHTYRHKPAQEYVKPPLILTHRHLSNFAVHMHGRVVGWLVDWWVGWLADVPPPPTQSLFNAIKCVFIVVNVSSHFLYSIFGCVVVFVTTNSFNGNRKTFVTFFASICLSVYLFHLLSNVFNLTLIILEAIK